MSKFIGIFMCSCMFLVLSCSQDTDKSGIQIPFASIVGNYNGMSKICTNTLLMTDTICSAPTDNVLNVVVYNSNSVKVKDSNNIFGLQILDLKESYTNNDGKFYTFALKNGSDFLLIFNSDKSEITYSQQTVNANDVLTNIFEGAK